ncbi:MAG: RNA polymerase sigma factor [Myxococcota bacterium]
MRVDDLTDPVVFDRFYRALLRDVLAWVIRLGGPLLDPEAVTQDAFVMAHRRASTFRGGSERAWMYGITRRVVANARRRAKLRQFIGLHTLAPLPDPGPTTDERVARLARRRRVQQLLEQLSDKHREALVLVDLEGHSAVEAAAMMGVAVNTVYSRLFYARKAFSALAGPEGAALGGGIAALRGER